MARDERDAAHDDRVGLGAQRTQLDAGDDDVRITSAISACASAAPMQRRMPPPNGSHAYDSAPSVEEALGAELGGLRVEVLAAVHERDRRIDA